MKTLTALALLIPTSLIAIGHGLVKDPTQTNRAILVGVSKNAFPNLVKAVKADLGLMKQIASHPNLKFKVKALLEEQATKESILKAIESGASECGAGGTLLIYVSGFGSGSGLEAHDKFILMSEVREAIERGRTGLGPVARLVLLLETDRGQMMFDYFEKGSTTPLSQEYFASAAAIDSSNVSETGSIFTTAFSETFKESIENGWTLKELAFYTQQKIKKTQRPVEFARPESILEEKVCRGTACPSVIDCFGLTSQGHDVKLRASVVVGGGRPRVDEMWKGKGSGITIAHKQSAATFNQNFEPIGSVTYSEPYLWPENQTTTVELPVNAELALESFDPKKVIAVANGITRYESVRGELKHTYLESTLSQPVICKAEMVKH